MSDRIRNERGPVRQAPNFSARERAYAGAYHIDKSPAGVALQRMAEMAAGSAERRAASASTNTSTAQLAAAEDEELLQGKFATAQRAGVEDEELLQGKFATAQRAGVEDEELLQGKFATAQRAGVEEEEPLQGKFATVQRSDSDEDELQMKAIGAPAAQREEAMPRRNDTGLPDQLKAGVESLSGMSLDHVKVHYNSAQPAQLNALAYAQGSDIHVAPGQEQHLPHEAWHIIQQAQGRVKPTMQVKDGVPVNDDAGLEREADVMGAQAAAAGNTSDQLGNIQRRAESAQAYAQLEPSGDQGKIWSLNFQTSTASKQGSAASVAQLRSKNPRRSDPDAYQPEKPVQEGLEPEYKLTEHHIVPHATLDAAKKKLGTDLNTTQFLPRAEEVTVRMMMNLKGGWIPKWVTDFNRANQPNLNLDGSAFDQRDRLFDWLQTKEQLGEDATVARARKFDFMAALSPGDAMDDEWVGAMIEWFPGNIVRGPTNRKWDQGADALDKELIFLINKTVPAHAAAATELMDACTELLPKPNLAPSRERTARAFTALNAFGYTNYNPNDWKRFDGGADATTPLQADAEMQVFEYPGNK